MAAVVSHPIQHFAPMFRDLAKIAGLDLRVFYCCDWGVRSYRDPGFGQDVAWDVPLLGGYAHEFLPIRRPPHSLTFWDVDNPLVEKRLSGFRPSAVWIHGYSHRTSWRVRKWARGRAKTLFFGDSELLHRRRPLIEAFKRVILPRFYKTIDAFITIGDNNEAYYRHYGVPDSKMFRGAFPVDIRRFRAAIESMTPADRISVRRRFGLDPEGFVVLFVGKFIGIKRPLDLIEAMARLKADGVKAQALFVGAGELEGAMAARIQCLSVGNEVRIAGFINQREMPLVLAAGDVLAMCSEKDPHPLAVTEAMAAGNSIVASDYVGCVGPTDAARPGENAIIFPCGNIDRLTTSLKTVACNADLRARMSIASLRICWTQDCQATISAVLSAMSSFGLTTSQA
jgi:glycosyltransferase involved in cell wall biosynthesis